MAKAEDAAAKAKHSQSDQALLDIAHLACDKCLEMVGLSASEGERVVQASYYLHEAGAVPVDTTEDGEDLASQTSPPASEVVRCDGVRGANREVLGVIAEELHKRERGHQQMMDIAHECLSKLSDGTICGRAAKIGARHSRETMGDLEAAHGHLVAAGARCDAAGTSGLTALIEDQQRDSEFELGKGVRGADLVQALAGERNEKAALAKALAEIVPMIERLTKRVDDIARTPLPPLTIAKGAVSVSKQQDRGSASELELSPEAIASALAKMTKEEQTLTLIKASYANPIRVAGSAANER